MVYINYIIDCIMYQLMLLKTHYQYQPLLVKKTTEFEIRIQKRLESIFYKPAKTLHEKSKQTLLD